MRVIKIPADIAEPMAELDVPSDYPAINLQLLGSTEDLIEQVYPKGLALLDAVPGHLVLLIDEEGLLKNLPLNKLASLLYGTHVHGQPICGDAYVVLATSEEWASLPASVDINDIQVAIERSIKFADVVFK